METFPALLAICAGNSPALIFSLICTWINGWVNNGDAGDLRRHRAHYDVIVIWMEMSFKNKIYICLWLLYPLSIIIDA